APRSTAGSVLGGGRRASAEQAGRRIAHGRLQTKVVPGGPGGHPPARRAHEQADLEQEGLVHVLDRLRLLAHGDGEGADADRSPAEVAAEGGEDGTVDLVEPQGVDAERGETGVGRLLVDDAGATHLGEVTDAPQEA